MNWKSRKRTAKLRLVVSAMLVALPLTPGAGAEVGDPLIGAVLRDLERSQGRLVELAEAIPQDKLDWRPSEGARSAAEALLHVAGANYLFADSLGVPIPDGITYRAAEVGAGFVFDLETEIKTKAEVTATLRESAARLQQAVSGLDGSDLGEVTLLANRLRFPRRDVLIVLLGHANTHLGQLVAYARMLDVVPPWSRGEQ